VPTKINIVLDDDVKADLYQLVESGGRSRVVNAALRREMRRLRRNQASERLDELRLTTRAVKSTELVSLVRGDRGR